MRVERAAVRRGDDCVAPAASVAARRLEQRDEVSFLVEGLQLGVPVVVEREIHVRIVLGQQRAGLVGRHERDLGGPARRAPPDLELAVLAGVLGDLAHERQEVDRDPTEDRETCAAVLEDVCRADVDAGHLGQLDGADVRLVDVEDLAIRLDPHAARLAEECAAVGRDSQNHLGNGHGLHVIVLVRNEFLPATSSG